MRRFILSLAVPSLAALTACSGRIDQNDAPPSGIDQPRGAMDPGSGGPRPNGGPGTGGPATTTNDPRMPSPVDMVAPPPPPPDLASAFSCNKPGSGAGPQRIWRLSVTQLKRTVNTLFSGRPTATNKPKDASMIEPWDPPNPADRYTNLAWSYGVSDGEFVLGLQSAHDVANRLLPNLKSKGCLGKQAIGDCVKTTVNQYGPLLFSRPLDPAEVADYAAIATANAPQLGDDRAMAVVIEMMLLSPNALFRTELGGGAPDASGAVHLTPYETAAALSYSVSDAPPDDVLWKAAQDNALNTPEQLRPHIDRMLSAGLAAQDSVTRFFREYLRYYNVFQVFKDATRYPFHKPADLAKETDDEIADMLTTAGHKDFLKTMLTSGDVFIHGSTPQSYNLESQYNSNLLCKMTGDFNCVKTHKVAAPPGQRAGLLTQPSFLASFSKPEETEPVQRGRFIAENLLCRSIPSPEGVIGMIPPLPDLGPNVTMRDRLSMHSKDPRCASCHMLMDPLGLPLEAYDHVGRFRSMENGKTIDASGTLGGSGNQDGAFMGPLELMNKLASSNTVAQCFVRQTFTYWMGRQDASGDSCSLTAALSAFQKGGDYGELLASLFSSRSLLWRSAKP